MKGKIVSAAFLVVFLTALQGPAFGAKNPLATNEQLFVENIASYIVRTSEVETAAQKLSQSLQNIVGTVSSENMAYLDDAVAEMVFDTAQSKLASDPNYPQFVSRSHAPHSWFGMDVPGSRQVFDNPDTIKWMANIDPTAGYVIYGKRRGTPPIDENYSLFDSTGNTLVNITGKKLVVEEDGSFTITVDSNPANGRQNHIQTTSTARLIYVRQTVTDWATQNFNRLRIERVEDGTTLPDPLTFDDLVTKSAAGLSTANFNIYNTRANAQAVNTLPAITRGGTAGTLVTQAQTYSRWALADDEALVVKVHLGGAKYFISPVYNIWQITMDYVNHTSSLNNAQAKPNPNGTYTFVISVKDPGVYNWVDTCGLHEGLLNLRWQGLPNKVPASGDVAATMKLVKLADLKSVLPATTKYVTAKERKAQLKKRAAAFARRFAENYSY